MSGVAIRSMRWWDIPDVSAIEEVTFPDDSWTAEQFWQELAQETRHYVVAVDEGRVVGYAGAFVLPPDSDVQTISVQAESQGRGIGAVLLGELMAVARAAGCRHMMLEVRSPNVAALALYERHGFTTISTRRRYYPNGDDALIMRAELRGRHDVDE